MLPIALIAVAIGTPAAQSAIVFSNLLPSPTFQYYSGGGGLVEGSDSHFAYQGIAQAFQPSASGWLQELDLGITYESTIADPLLLELEGNIPGSHLPDGNVLTSGFVVPVAEYATTPTALTVFTPGGSPIPLTAGSTYWAIVLPTDPATSDVWNGIQDFGWAGYTTDGSSFATSNEQGNALQVQAVPTPEPSTGSLLAATGLLLHSCTGRRRIRSGRNTAARQST